MPILDRLRLIPAAASSVRSLAKREATDDVLYRILPIALWAAVSGTMFGIAGSTLIDEREAITRRAQQQEGNIALAVQGEIARTIATVDMSLRAAAQGAAMPGLAGLDPAIRQAVLFNAAPLIEGGGVIIADETGRVIDSSPGVEHPPANVFNRPQFQAQLSHPDRGLFIGPPMRSLSDAIWILGLSRRVTRPDGSFGGAVLGRLTLGFLQRLFDRLDIGASGIINLVSTDGKLIARRPLAERDIGRDMSASEMFGHLKDAPAGSFEAVASIDGIPRLYSYRKVDNLPFVVGVGFPDTEIYGPWRRKMIVLCGVLAALSLLLLGAVLLLRRELIRRQRAERAALVSERRHDEARLRLAALFMHSPDIMVVVAVDPDNRLLYEEVNPVWERVTGVPKASAIGRSPDDCLTGDLSARVLDGMRACLAERREAQIAFQTGHDAEARAWEGSIVPVTGAAGAIERIIAVARDVTERESSRLRMLASARLSALGAMAGGIAHEINNPLAVIHAVASDLGELAEAGEVTAPDVAKASGRIVQYADRIGRIVTSLRFISRDGKRDAFDRASCREIVARSVDLARERFRQNGVELQSAQVDPSLRVQCREVQICQILTNLLHNAFDAALEGPAGKWVRLEVATRDDLVCLSVIDSGPGVPADLRVRIMEPFFTTKPVGKGTGLGLSLSRQIAEEHGGTLELGERDGHTCFTLTLPLCQKDAAGCC